MAAATEEEESLSKALQQTELSSSAPTTTTTTTTTTLQARPECLPASISRSFVILGVETDAWVQIFADRIMVGVTQLNQKVGNWCLCQAEQSEVNHKAIDFTINTVLGDRKDAMIGVYARRITELIIQRQLVPGSNYMAVFLGISLKDKGTDRAMFQEVVNVLVDMVADALKL
mmetsp:Transcript_10051/g.23953  ORF Transcript_10051/g.23953 Transcript_10051/m.23953 type:complete len:173 (+) Transcript_10051:65-583(+)